MSIMGYYVLYFSMYNYIADMWPQRHGASMSAVYFDLRVGGPFPLSYILADFIYLDCEYPL